MCKLINNVLQYCECQCDFVYVCVCALDDLKCECEIAMSEVTVYTGTSLVEQFCIFATLKVKHILGALIFEMDHSNTFGSVGLCHSCSVCEMPCTLLRLFQYS